MTGISEAELIENLDPLVLILALRRLASVCRRHQLPPGRCRCQGCPLEDACADHLDDADSLAEFCIQAIENIREIFNHPEEKV